MATGRVLQFDQERGYGFVAADDGGEDVFLHASVFDGDSEELAPGIKVSFKIMAGDRGRKAFAAYRVDDDHDLEDDRPAAARAVPKAPPLPPAGPTTAPPLPPVPSPRAAEELAPDEESMCDVLSPAEFGKEFTELLLRDVPTLNGQQIVMVRDSLLDWAKKHGWVDI